MTKPDIPDLPEPRFQINDLCALTDLYLTPEEVAELYRAYLVSAEAHDGQMRRSGEPYIFHPLSVAGILARLRMDTPTLIAALLHDVIEDTHITKEQIASTFGAQVADLVDGVSKLRNMNFANKAEAQAASFHKMIMAMTRDIRVILLKLADRLHNMRTIKHMKAESRRRKSRETLEIYAPIAARLCIGNLAEELEDLSFAGLYPWRHRIIKKQLEENLRKHHELLNKIQAAVEHRLAQQGIAAKVELYQKSAYALYKKLPRKQRGGKQLFKDTFGFRIIVADVDHCYRVLGAVHSLYKPKPGNFKDYIAIPRANHYQSLHTRLFGYKGLSSIDVRIRTQDMQNFAEYGIIVQGLYRSGKAQAWLGKMNDLLGENPGDFVDFMANVKLDLFPDEVYVFTPKGDIIELPKGATAVDFAYAIHSDLGNKLNAVKIDDQMMAPLNTQLRSGQTIEVFTANWTSPKPEWLDFAVTAKARSHIRQFLKGLNQEQAMRLGQRIFDRELERYNLSVDKLSDVQRQLLLEKFGFADFNALLTDIGLGNHLAYLVARHLQPELQDTPLAPLNTQLSSSSPSPLSNAPLVIKGTEGMVVSLAKCCRPIPGDAIKGYVSPGRGIVVHTHNCKNMNAHRSPNSLLELTWAELPAGEFLVDIRVEVSNSKGVLGKVSTTLGNIGINIEAVSSDPHSGANSSIDFSMRVRDRRHLAQVLRALRQQVAVKRVMRKTA